MSPPFADYVTKWVYHLSLLSNLIISRESLGTANHGFNKVLVFAAANGNLIAVKSQTGEIIWTRFLMQQILRIQIDELNPESLHLKVTFFDQSVAIVNAMTGVVHRHDDSTIPITNTDIAATRSWDHEKNTISGHNNDGQQTWIVKIPTLEKIYTILRADIGPIASIGRVLGNRTVLYKYLNPNYIVVATKKSDSTIIYFIETVSGSIMERLIFYGIQNLKLVSNQNFLAMTFQRKLGKLKNLIKIQQEISITELYESLIPDARYER